MYNDLQDHQQALQDTITELKPMLLVLDPFVRLRAIDENVAAEVAPLLAYLRRLQRLHQTAVALVHHSRKSAHERGGQALRGSSELHAWGDSNLYLRRNGQQLQLSVEHRAAQGAERVLLALKAILRPLPWRRSTSRPPTLRPSNLPALSASNSCSPTPQSRSRPSKCVRPCACAPAMSVRSIGAPSSVG
jgi:hypothetical protein